MSTFRTLRRRLLGSATALTLATGLVTAFPSVSEAWPPTPCSDFVSIAAGGNHSLALANDGTVWAWGHNYYGEVGDGTTQKRTSAVRVEGLSDVTAIAAGYQHSLAISGGVVYAWGANSFGQLGDGSTQDRLTPVPVSTDGYPATSISAGERHSLAVAGGAVYAWGDNEFGQLADGSTTDHPTPTRVGGTEGVSAVAAGGRHSLALLPGAVLAWGENDYGQLGDGTTTLRRTPVVVTLAGASSITAGFSHSMAVVAGTAWAWGANNNGQLGDGSTASRPLPLPVDPGAGPAVALAGGGGHSVAAARGQAVAWGWNAHHQLGDGTTDNRALPQPVPGLTGVTAVAGGGFHTLAIVAGTIYAWGNDNAVLSTTPTAVTCDSPAVVFSSAAVPQSAVAGTPVRFAVRWTHPDPAATGRLLICRTAAVDYFPTGLDCVGGRYTWSSYSQLRVADAAYSTTNADVGTNVYYAILCLGAGPCSAPVRGTFDVVSPVSATYVSDTCDVAGTNVVTGFVGDAYVKAKWQSAPQPETTWVCIAAEHGAVHLGGRVAVGGVTTGSVVAVDDDAAAIQSCAGNANNVPIQSGTVLGGQPYWIHVTPVPASSTDAAWVCVRFTSTLGMRLRFSGAGVGSVSGFAADPPAPHTPAYTTGLWPAAGPSATCAAAVSGRTRYVDARVGDVPVAMYGWSESPVKTHLCLRGGGAGGAGGRLTVDSGAAPSVATGTTTAPCPFDVFTRSDAPSFGLYISDPANVGLPVSACAAVGGTAMSATVSWSGGSLATWSPDPA